MTSQLKQHESASFFAALQRRGPAWWTGLFKSKKAPISDDFIQGHCDPRFLEVKNAFRRNFKQGPEVGASVCIYHRGKPVVDLWAGLADPETGQRWQRDTVTVLASTSKCLASTAVLLLVQRGQIELDAPIVKYWSEFGKAGKDGVTVRQLLAHQAGVAALDCRPISAQDKRAMKPITDAIAAQAPWWTPGEGHGYHAVTYGFALSELIRRVTGKTVGRFFAAEIAKPLGLDLHIGLAASQHGRVAHMIGPTTGESLLAMANPKFFPMYRALVRKSSLAYKATYGALEARFEDKAAQRYYDIEDASATALGNAHGLARMFASLIGEVDGKRLLSPSLVEEARQPLSDGIDKVLLLHTVWGLGYMLPGGPMWPAFGASAFGHGGASGSLAFADPENAIAFGYVPNKWAEQRVGFAGTQPRYLSLVEAAYRALRLRG